MLCGLLHAVATNIPFIYLKFTRNHFSINFQRTSTSEELHSSDVFLGPVPMSSPQAEPSDAVQVILTVKNTACDLGQYICSCTLNQTLSLQQVLLREAAYFSRMQWFTTLSHVCLWQLPPNIVCLHASTQVFFDFSTMPLVWLCCAFFLLLLTGARLPLTFSLWDIFSEGWKSQSSRC